MTGGGRGDDGYDVWLLDLDGTVVDVERSYARRVVHECGDRLGVEFDDREAEVLWYGGGARDRVFDRRGVDPEAFWEVFHDVDAAERRAEATYVYEDAAAAVPELPGPVGLVTHCQEYLTGPVLDRLGIADWFDTVVCCTPETGWKPDPTPVELALERLGVGEAPRGLLAGDDPRDVQAAHNAGLEGVHVVREEHATATGAGAGAGVGAAAADGGVPAGATRVRALTALPG